MGHNWLTWEEIHSTWFAKEVESFWEIEDQEESTLHEGRRYHYVPEGYQNQNETLSHLHQLHHNHDC